MAQDPNQRKDSPDDVQEEANTKNRQHNYEEVEAVAKIVRIPLFHDGLPTSACDKSHANQHAYNIRCRKNDGALFHALPAA